VEIKKEPFTNASQVSGWRRSLCKDVGCRSLFNPKRSQAWIKKMLEQIDTGLSFSGAKLTLGEYLQSWLQNAKARSVPRRMTSTKALFVITWLRPLGSIRLSELQPQSYPEFIRTIDRKWDKPTHNAVDPQRYSSGIGHCPATRSDRPKSSSSGLNHPAILKAKCRYLLIPRPGNFSLQLSAHAMKCFITWQLLPHAPK